MRFSKHFKLNKSQAELDFVDIPLETDIRLFIDPHVIGTREDLLSVKCNNIIVNFFQGVLSDIRNGNDTAAKHKLNQLSEPNETHLGLSSDKPKGRGVSGKQSLDLYKKLKVSRAVKTGFLKDLSDSELVIEGISNDKISDITTNIIKKQLIEYTTDQCKANNIPTQNVASGKFWDPETQAWKSDYVELPIVNGKRIILIPKIFARYRLQYDYKKYYNGFVLEYLQEEHIGANSSLVKLLKGGGKKVYKKDLKKKDEYKLSKEFLYEFSMEHPEVMRKYTKSVSTNVVPLSDDEIERKQPNPKRIDIGSLKNKLAAIPSGKEHADEYHNAIIGILEAIFSPNLYAPAKEEPLHDGRKRIDITYLNAAKSGFFEYLAKHIHCPVVVCECKNYEGDPKNPELDQLAMRLSKRRGEFGLLVCRTVKDKAKMLKHCQDRLTDDKGYIVVLDDSDLDTLLDWKAKKDYSAIDNFLTERYKELILNQQRRAQK